MLPLCVVLWVVTMIQNTFLIEMLWMVVVVVVALGILVGHSLQCKEERHSEDHDRLVDLEFRIGWMQKQHWHDLNRAAKKCSWLALMVLNLCHP